MTLGPPVFPDPARRPLRYLSVCSGIEAASVAWHPLGWQPVAFAEIDPFCKAVLEHHYPHVPNFGDFRQIGADDVARLGGIDVLVGGPPCQAFSVAGLRGGMDDPRGNLTLEFCRLADRLRPRWVVYENVPGLLSSGDGRDFALLLGGLTGRVPTVPSGGWGTAGVAIGPRYGAAWRVLDAQYFGVPQRRRRIFLISYLGDWRPATAVLFERHGMRGDSPPRRSSRQGASTGITVSAGTGSSQPHAGNPGSSSQPGSRGRGRPELGSDVATDTANTLGSGHGAGGWGYDLDRGSLVPSAPPRHAADHTVAEQVSLIDDSYPQTVGTLCASNGPHSHGTGSFTGNQAVSAGYIVPDVVGTLTCNSGPNGHDAGNFSCNTAVDAGYIVPYGSGHGDVSHTLQTNAGGPRCPSEETYVVCPADEVPARSRLVIGQNGGDIQVSSSDQAGTLTSSQARQTSGDLIAEPIVEPIAFAATSRGTWAPPSPSVNIGQSPTLDTTREMCVAVPVQPASGDVRADAEPPVFHATGASRWQPGPGTLRAHADGMINLVVLPDQEASDAFDRYLRSEPGETVPTLRSGSCDGSHQTGPAGFVPHVMAPQEHLPEASADPLQPVAFDWQAPVGDRQYIVRPEAYAGAIATTRRDAVMIPFVGPSTAGAGADVPSASVGESTDPGLTFEPRYYSDRQPRGGKPGEVTGPLRASVSGTGDGFPHVIVPQAGSGGDRPDAGVAEDTQPIAFSCKNHGADAGDLAPTLRACGHANSHANGGGQIAVVFQQNQREEVRLFAADGQIAGPLTAGQGRHCQNFVAMLPDADSETAQAPQTDAPAVDTAITVTTMSLRGRDGATLPELGGDIAPALRASQGGADKPYVLVSPAVVNGNSTPEVSDDCAFPLRADDGSGNRQVVALVQQQPEVVSIRVSGDYANPSVVLDDQVFLAANPMSDRQMVVAVPCNADQSRSDGDPPATRDTASTTSHPVAVSISGSTKRDDRPMGGLYVTVDTGTAKTLDTSGSSLTSAQGGVGVLQPTYTISNQPTPKVAHDLAPTLEAKADGGGRMDCVAVPAMPVATFQQSSLNGRGTFAYDATSDTAKPVTTGPDRQMLHIYYAVRRLTPEECEALQGFPRGYTLVHYRRGLAADGPRYKALGNSMATPCMRWIGEGMAMVEMILMVQATCQTQSVDADPSIILDLQAAVATDDAGRPLLVSSGVSAHPRSFSWQPTQGWLPMLAPSPGAIQIGTVLALHPSQIEPDPGQPRQDFDNPEQVELGQSVRAHGVQQPIEVCVLADGRYRIVDGERRWRAAQDAGLDEIPCFVIGTSQSYLKVRTRQVIANSLQRPLTPLEDAQALYLLWLAQQVEALERELDDDGSRTAMLLDECGPPTMQIAVLSDRLCQLAGVATVADYTGGGRVRVTWQTVLEGCGRGDWTPDRRKKHLRVLDVDPKVQDVLAGLQVSARTIHALADLPTDQQAELVDQAIQTAGSDGDIGAALRAAVEAVPTVAETPVQVDDEEPDVAAAFHAALDSDAALSPARLPIEALATSDEEMDWERVPGAGLDEVDTGTSSRQGNAGFVPDRELAFPFKSGPGREMISERGPIGHGNVPPEGHDRIPRADALRISQKFDDLLSMLDDLGPRYFEDADVALLRSNWNELVSRLGQAGLHADI